MMDGSGVVSALVLVVLLLNAGVLVATWRLTLGNRRSLDELRERERRAERVLHDAAMEQGHVLTLVHDDHDDHDVA